MKTFRSILLLLATILNLPIAILLTFGVTWFSLPALQNLMINTWRISFLNNTLVF